MAGATGREGSTGRLLQLCLGYFVFYLITGVTVKYFLRTEEGFPGMHGMEFLVYSTLGGNAIALSVVLIRRWYHLRSTRLVQLGPWKIPRELLYIVPSGVCTAVVIPTTTLMYTLPISVMVAMVIMRGSVILLSRLIDAIQIRQGILDKKVYWEENTGVVFAVLAVGVHLVGPLLGDSGGEDHFGFFKNPIAMGILGSYITAYGIRIYIMNYYKNTRPKGAPHDNRGFFAFEQIAASITMVTAVIVLMNAPALFGWNPIQLQLFSGAIRDPLPGWGWAVLAGMAFGIVSFFSVFIFMFKGRTATFAGLVNRLTSLIAGTASTVLFAVGFGGDMPERWDWISLGFILMAVALLTRAERKRTAELAASRS